MSHITSGSNQAEYIAIEKAVSHTQNQSSHSSSGHSRSVVYSDCEPAVEKWNSSHSGGDTNVQWTSRNTPGISAANKLANQETSKP